MITAIPTPLPWSSIKTVFLDLDGTLLDLHYDAHFWLEHLPSRVAQEKHISLNQAKQLIHTRVNNLRGTLEWYSTDAWSRWLELDITQYLSEIAQLIQARPGVYDFLAFLTAHNIPTILATNSSRQMLEVKFANSDVEQYLDRVVSSHDLGIAKEDPEFWRAIGLIQPYDPASTLFIDDNASVLDAAVTAGIGYCLAVVQPNSQLPEQVFHNHQAFAHFDDLH